MLNIEKIKQECIDIDMQNVAVGDKSIGTYIDGKFFQFRDLQDVELFYKLMHALLFYANKKYNIIKNIW